MYGKQEPSVHVAPFSVESHGAKACELMRVAGIRLMDWQSDLLDDWLALTQSGDWAATSCGLSVPRQNGKTFVIASRIAWGMVAYAEWCVYTSHLQKTSTETFEQLRDIFESPSLSKYVKDIKSALGREEIVLTNGGRAKFLARTRNGGRGQHGDLWVVDEAQELTFEQQASFLPLLAASKRPQTIYLGTPPDESAPGVVFANFRKEVTQNNTKRSAWAEWSTDDIGDVTDRERWAQCNPSLGYMIKESTIEGECEQMAKDGFARERLGWWAPMAAKEKNIIDASLWQSCKVASRPSGGVDAYGVKFSPDGATVCVSVCRKVDDEYFVELLFNESTGRGTAWLVEWIHERKDKVSLVAIDGSYGAMALIDRLAEVMPAKSVTRPKVGDVIGAAASMLTAVNEHKLQHCGQPQLEESATKTTRRSIGTDGGWGFKSTDQADATPIESAALAMWAASHTKRNPSRKMMIA